MNDWRIVPISEICDFIVDCLHETPEIVGESTGFLMVRTSDIKDGVVNLETARNVSEETYNRRIQRGKPQQNDIIISREAPLGEVGRVPKDSAICLGQRLIHYRIDSSKADPRYVIFALLSPTVQQEFQANKGVGSVVDNLRMHIARALPVPLPPLPEQRAIAHILGSLDDKIELNRRMNATLEETARALFTEWFVHFRYPGHESVPFVESELGLIPQGWRVEKLGEVIELAYGKALKAESRVDGDVPVFGSNGQIGWHDQKLGLGPGIVVGRKGNPGTVIWSQKDFFVIDTAFYVVPKTLDYIRYLYFDLQLQDLPSLSADSAVPGLNRNLAYMSSILIPSEPILVLFEEVVASTMNMYFENELESRTLAHTRDALLPKLVSGEVRVG